MKKLLCKAGQSTMEYVIVLTAIIAAILFAAVTFIKPSVNRVYNQTSSTMDTQSSFFLNKVGVPQNGIPTGTGGTGTGTTGGTTSGTGGAVGF
ncbi:MAG: hypothetical protein ACM3L6_07165 [Deltaproteobacteria bacterium]